MKTLALQIIIVSQMVFGFSALATGLLALQSNSFDIKLLVIVDFGVAGFLFSLVIINVIKLLKPKYITEKV